MNNKVHISQKTALEGNSEYFGDDHGFIVVKEDTLDFTGRAENIGNDERIESEIDFVDIG
jgi:hypothetical protein